MVWTCSSNLKAHAWERWPPLPRPRRRPPIQELRRFSHPACGAWRERVGCREVKGVGPPGIPDNSRTYVGDRRFPKSPLSWLHLRKDTACVPVGCRSLCIQQSPLRFRQTNGPSVHSYFPVLTVMPRPWTGPQPPKGGERLRSLEATSDSDMLRCWIGWSQPLLLYLLISGLCWVFSPACVLFSSCGQRGATLASGAWASLVAELKIYPGGLGNWSSWAWELWHMGLVVPRHVGSSWIRGQTCVSCIGRRVLYHWAAQGKPSRLFFLWPLLTWGGYK